MESEWEFDSEWVDAYIDYALTEKETHHELIDYMDQLIQYSSIPEERKESLYREIYTMNYEKAIKLVEELQGKQVNRIHAGFNYNMTYIKDFLKKSI